MAQKFVKVVGIHKVFNTGTDDYVYSALKSTSDVTSVVNENSILFITADASDHTNYSKYSIDDKFIWTKGDIYNCNEIKNTTGSSDSDRKLYLVGAPTQDANGVETFSNSVVYTQNGCIYSNSVQVSNDAYIQGDLTTSRIQCQSITVDDDYHVMISQGAVTADDEVNAPTLKEGGIALSNKYETKNRCLPLSGGTMTGNIDMNSNSLNIYNKTKVGQVNGYLGLYSTSNEMVIGNGSTDTTMYINYRQPGSGYIAPETYAFMAGSSSSYANVTANHFYSVSDERLKNIHGEIDLDKAYDLIDKCSTILYDLKDDEEHKVQVGVIAQEIQNFFPEIINEDEKGTLSVDYSKLTVIIMKVLKDLINRIKKLEEK